ncbi:SDR family oxidoreductase [Amycolatopsis sp. PS_44_ISF1]|uniref:SDR family oxidoreductase n=1 Tax=Amycolatopsis sp. PS_44_ISF1 TaxID=2974917 RepID=UPI0028DEF5BA|nr:SDR family oxidoreductase [Amycolatopsis sp. PS_44_ISF1]MDT8916013.1 SDR family oxidoreductase [Amycolatopsis sp. PS_44_ISF1]
MTKARVAVVTGASSGIGRAVVTNLAGAGTRVVAAGRRAEALAELATYGAIVPFAAEMTRPGHTEELLGTAEREWGPATIAVLAAGQGLPGTVLGSDPARWRELLEVNYFAVLDQLRVCGARFREQAEADGGGQARDIVVIGSTVGRQVSAANPVYGSTKFAVHSLVEALRQEVCEFGIRVTLVEPGFVRSGFQQTAGYDQEWFESVADQYGPLLVPEDVATVVDFVVTRPNHVHLDDIRLRPTRQKV